MGYLLPPNREAELGEERAPSRFSGWPERAVVGDYIELRRRGINREHRLGDVVEGPQGELAEVVAVHPGGAMYSGSIALEVRAPAGALEAQAEPYRRTRQSAFSDG